jgi:alpha-tubulin suppressor-like RCC1 family protein
LGQLGVDYAKTKSSPESVTGSYSYTAIGGGDVHNLGLRSNGSVWAWGYNGYGQLGNNTTSEFNPSPISVVGNHSFVEVAAGYVFSLARKADGSIWSWGSNGYYTKLGDGTTIDRSSPVSVIGDHSFTAISAGWDFSVALKADGSVWGWGTNDSHNQLGDGTSTNRASPVSVVGDHSFVQISAGGYFTLARKADGSVWGWGKDDFGQLGDNRAGPETTTIDSGNYKLPFNYNGMSYEAQITQTSYTGSALATEIKNQMNAQIFDTTFDVTFDTGKFTISNSSMTFDLLFMMGMDMINHVIGFNDTDYSWEQTYTSDVSSAYDAPITPQSSPVSVAGGHSFVEIAAGYESSMARKADGSVWTWGYNEYGQLGINSVSNKLSPVSVIGDHSFTNIYACGESCFAKKADGTIWSWGYNVYGLLMDGTQDNKSSPVSVLGANSFVSIFGKNVTFVLKKS